MTKNITTIVLFFLYLSSVGQDSLHSCKCSSYFDSKAIERDTANKDFYAKYNKINTEYSDGCDDIKLLKDTAGFFYIQPFYLSPIHKDEKYYLKNNGQFFVHPLSDLKGNIVLYKDHDELKSKKVFVHKYGHPPIDQVSHSMRVLNCFEEWVKVSLVFKGKEYIGWTKYFCPLGCTTCT